MDINRARELRLQADLAEVDHSLYTTEDPVKLQELQTKKKQLEYDLGQIRLVLYSRAR